MEEKHTPGKRTWDDVRREQGLPPQQGDPDGDGCGAPPPGKPGRRPHHGEPGKHVGAGRVTAYLLLTVLLNVVLAVYTLYILGISAESAVALLDIGRVESIPRLLFGVLILISPLLLTILFNRLLYRAMRGRRRFPRGIWLFATLLVVIVQALTIYVLFTAGAAPQIETFTVESFATEAY